MKKILFGFFVIVFSGCTPYTSPERATWKNYLYGATFTDMNDVSQTAKKPILLGAGGRTVANATVQQPEMEYGDKSQNESMMYLAYMSEMEMKLYDELRRPGMSVQRVGTDILVILVRDAIMELNAPEISAIGDENLKIISRILNQYDATFVEIAGYTDSMRDTNAARALSTDMAERVAVYFARHDVKPTRMFIVGRGSARPIAAQDEWGRLTNRRVELRISPVR